MGDFVKQLAEYRRQLRKGDVPAAYNGLIHYYYSLRLHLKQRHTDTKKAIAQHHPS